MSSSDSSSTLDYTAFDEEFDMVEKENEDTVLALHTHNNKRPKRGGSVVGHAKLHREWTHAQLLRRAPDQSRAVVPSPVSDGDKVVQVHCRGGVVS
jgi:hypothetical protein